MRISVGKHKHAHNIHAYIEIQASQFRYHNTYHVKYISDSSTPWQSTCTRIQCDQCRLEMYVCMEMCWYFCISYIGAAQYMVLWMFLWLFDCCCCCFTLLLPRCYVSFVHTNPRCIIKLIIKMAEDTSFNSLSFWFFLFTFKFNSLLNSYLSFHRFIYFVCLCSFLF